MAENKSSQYRAMMNVYSSNATNYINSITPITPFTSFLSIPQGLGAGERTGNQINIKKLEIKGVITPTGYDVTTNPSPRPGFLKLFFLTRKDSPMELYTNTGDVFQYANSSEGFGTTVYNLQRPVNTDEWMVHTTRTFKVGYSINSGTGAGVNNQYHANNDFKLANFFSINLTKNCLKTIKFDDNTVNPSSRNIVMYPVFYPASGTALAVSEIPAQMHYHIHIEYEDM